MRISDWSSDVCSSDLRGAEVGGHDRLGDRRGHPATGLLAGALLALDDHGDGDGGGLTGGTGESHDPGVGAGRVGAELRGAGLAANLEAGDGEPAGGAVGDHAAHGAAHDGSGSSEEHNAELTSLMRIPTASC